MLIIRENLRIRNATVDDAELLCHWWNDGKVMAHAGFPLGLGTDPETVRQQMQSYSDDAGRCLIIEIAGKTRDAPIGEMNYRNVGSGVAEIGIKICEPGQQGKGYGPVLLRMLITNLFHDFGYEKIMLDTNLNNTRAQHVYEELGFCKLRVRHNAWRDQLGAPQSAVDYELTKAAFDAIDTEAL